MNTPLYDEWFDLAQRWALNRKNLSAEEILATIWEESSGNPNATNPADPSWGLMGISKWIADAYCPGCILPDDMYNPNKNIQAGSGFKSYLKAKYAERYPLDSADGYIQMYNLGETKFLAGERAPGYQAAYVAHLAEMLAITESERHNS